LILEVYALLSLLLVRNGRIPSLLLQRFLKEESRKNSRRTPKKVRRKVAAGKTSR